MDNAMKVDPLLQKKRTEKVYDEVAGDFIDKDVESEKMDHSSSQSDSGSDCDTH